MKLEVMYSGPHMHFYTECRRIKRHDGVPNGLFARVNPGQVHEWELFSGYFFHELTHLFLLQLVNFRDAKNNSSSLTNLQEILVASLMYRVFPPIYQRGISNSNEKVQQSVTALLLAFQQIFCRLISNKTAGQILQISNQLLELYGRRVFENPRHEFEISMRDLPLIKFPKCFKFDNDIFSSDASNYSIYLESIGFCLLPQMLGFYEQSWKEMKSGKLYKEIIVNFFKHFYTKKAYGNYSVSFLFLQKIFNEK